MLSAVGEVMGEIEKMEKGLCVPKRSLKPQPGDDGKNSRKPETNGKP